MKCTIEYESETLLKELDSIIETQYKRSAELCREPDKLWIYFGEIKGGLIRWFAEKKKPEVQEDGLMDIINRLVYKGAAYKKFAEFVAQALNEREKVGYGGPKRWKLREEGGEIFIFCSNCYREKLAGKKIFFDSVDIRKLLAGYWNHCPNCGIRLLPPEEGK